MSKIKIATTTLVIIIFILGIILFSTILMGYDYVIDQLITYLKLENKTDKVRALLNREKFHYLQGLMIFSIITLAFIIKYIDRILETISGYIKDLLHSTSKLIFPLREKGNFIAILLPIGCVIYYAITMPVAYDEAWTYLNYSSKNIFVSMTNYREPNNHIFHSLLTNLTNLLFPSYPLLSLRLPTLIVSLLTYLISLYTIEKHFSRSVALLTTGIFPVLFMGIYFGYMSRGYAMNLLFFIICFHFTLNIIKEKGNKRNWLWFSFFSILGFLTMPSFLYPFIILNTIILIYSFDRTTIVSQIKYSTVTILTSILLYIPAIIYSGIENVTNNRWVATKPRNVVLQNLPDYLLRALEDITGFNPYVVISIITISLFLLFWNKQQTHLKNYALLLIFPPILLLIHSVIPFTRTFSYYGFVITLFFITSLIPQIEKIKQVFLIIMILFIQVALIMNFDKKIFNKDAEEVKVSQYLGMKTDFISFKIAKEKKRYMINDQMFLTFLRFNLKNKKIKNYSLELIKPNRKMNADTVLNFDYVIIAKYLDETRTKKSFFENEYFSIYK